MYARATAFLLVASMPLTAAAGDLVWRDAEPDTLPPFRSRGAMAYHEGEDRIVLWGGLDPNNNVISGTFTWDGGDWEESSDTYEPPRRVDMAMAPMPIDGTVVMFGGSGFPDSSATSPVPLNDTWVWGGSWSMGFSTDAPEPRWGHAMVYDGSAEAILLFGGFSDAGGGSVFYGFTWVFDGSGWFTVSQDTNFAPTARAWHAMAYDSERDVTVLFGGFDFEGSERDDTWEWDGSSWSLAGAFGPSARTRHTMHYDDVRHVVVLHGGWQTSFDPPIFLDDTWEYDGDAWVEVETDEAPSMRAGHAVAYHPGKGKALMHGGAANNIAPMQLYDDTWEIFAQRSHYGCNCRGTDATPLALVAVLALWRRRRRT